MLTLSRDDAGVTQSADEPVALSALLHELVESMQPLAIEKQQDLAIGDLDATATVLAAPGRLWQVFHNLVDNAIKYTPEGGMIQVSSRCADGEVIVEVQDNGIGIPSEHLPRIFDRFYRVTKPTSSAQGGAGLGLSIVQSIVTSLEGGVEVESTPARRRSFASVSRSPDPRW